MPSLVERLWAEQGLRYRLARAALQPLAWSFEVLTTARGVLYDTGLVRTCRARVPVISVGNLRVGGTGKTPLVIWLVERLAERGIRAAVVARGYGTSGSQTTVVAPAASGRPARAEEALRGMRWIDAADAQLGSARDVADEALLIALRTGAPVVTDVDRVRACQVAERAFTPDLVILDDGFQHRRLWRDLDIVLVDERDRVASLLPAGPLREPWRALSRAEVVIVTTPTPTEPHLVRRAAGLVDRVDARTDLEPVAELRGATVLAVAAIARPQEFVSMLAAAGADVRDVLTFRDHHRYTEADWRGIAAAATQVRRIVTTEKDLVKLAPIARGEDRLAALRLAIELGGARELLDLICARIRLDPKRRGQHDRGLRA